MLSAAHVFLSVIALAGASLHAADSHDESGASTPAPEAEQFILVRRGADLEATYTLENATIPIDEVHTLLPKDAIPALTDPQTESLKDAMTWLGGADRALVLTIKDESYIVPLAVLDWHEIVNTTVGGQPVALTYCPLCDSATVVSRTITNADGTEQVLEFGVSGALYNSNVLMYDRTDQALWSQLGMGAVTGPHAGMILDHYPVRVLTMEQVSTEYQGSPVVSRDTGHTREYGSDPYRAYFDSERLMVSVSGVDDAVPAKTLGLGVLESNGNASFLPVTVGTGEHTLKLETGLLRVRVSEDTVEVLEAPEDLATAQTFYYSWSAFHASGVTVLDAASDDE